MQRDVKIGIAIGVLLIALIAVFWWARKNSRPGPVDTVVSKEGEPMPPAPVAPPTGLPGPETGPAVAATMPAAPGPVMTPAGPSAVVPPTGPETAVTPAPVPPPTAAAPKTYKVKSGDTLSSIAKEFYGKESKWQAIYKANQDKLKSPDALKEGMVLTIPDVSGTTPPAATTPAPGAPSAGTASKPTPGQKYVVVSGDTLSKIAKAAYGAATPANINRIFQANKSKLSSPDDVQAGMELMIPAAH